MSGDKRPASETFGTSQLVKRQRNDGDANTGALQRANGSALVPGGSAAGLPASVMELSGHSAEVFCARFDPSGAHIASGSMDKTILLWNSAGACANYGILTGHKSAVLDLQWSRDSQVIYSASADRTVASFNVETGERIRKHIGHDEVINCLDVSKRGEEFLISGSDDGYICVWDPRAKAAIDEIETSFPVTAIALAEAGNELFTGGVDNEIKVWDLRMKKVQYTLTGHADTITSLAVSPDTQSLLSNSHDSTVRVWDIRPFAPADRAVKTYDGAQVGLEKNLFRACWGVDGKMIAAGGGDGTATVWDSKSAKLISKLPGHKGAVNDVRISPHGTMILSASTDRNMLLGQLPR